MSQILSKTKN